MAGEPITTVVGNLTDDPELRFTQSSRAVCSFTVASTPRRRQGDEWIDGDTLFQRCNLWGPAAENLAGSDAIRRGTRVIVHGRLRQRNWEDKEGNKRSTFELEVDELGASVQFATIGQIEKAGRGGGGGRRNDPPPIDDDPWAPQNGGGGGGGGGGNDEPPW